MAGVVLLYRHPKELNRINSVWLRDLSVKSKAMGRGGAVGGGTCRLGFRAGFSVKSTLLGGQFDSKGDPTISEVMGPREYFEVHLSREDLFDEFV
jgi:hypothetical protein